MKKLGKKNLSQYNTVEAYMGGIVPLACTCTVSCKDKNRVSGEYGRGVRDANSAAGIVQY